MAEEQVKEAKEAKEAKEPKEAKKAKEAKGTKETKATKKTQAAKETGKWDSKIKKLGDDIMGLTLMQAKELGDYL